MKRRGHSIIRCIILLFAYRSWEKLRERSVVIIDIQTSTIANVNRWPYQLCHLPPRHSFLLVMLVFLCLVLGFKFGSLLDGSVPFILSLSAANLSHRKPAITETSCDNCHVSGLPKRNTLYFIAGCKVVHSWHAACDFARAVRLELYILLIQILGRFCYSDLVCLFATLNVEFTRLNNMK